MSSIVIRLHPQEPLDNGDLFKPYLKDLEITVGERSFTDPKGTVNILGTAKYIAEFDPNATIIQHTRIVGPVEIRVPAATAVVFIPDPFPFVEYQKPDLVLTITRGVAPNVQTIIHRDINFNVDLAPGPKPASNRFVYKALTPTSLYVALPKPLVGLGTGVAHVDLPTDGTPPPYQAVLDAMNIVLAADPAVAVDLTKLTVEQCRHIAREIINNRTLSPLPVPPVDLDQLYDKTHEAERKQFESDLLTFYAVHDTQAEALMKFIYSVSAALACEKLTEDAAQVAFTFPILPGLAPVGGKIPEATVIISQ